MVSRAKVDEDARRGRGPLRVVTGSGVMRSPARLTGSTAAHKRQEVITWKGWALATLSQYE